MKNTKIEWCDHTVNFWWGCSEISEACQNCYAREIARRFKRECWGKKPRLFRLEKATEELLRLNQSARRRGVKETVFINSMSDFFDTDVAPEIRLSLWQLFADAENLNILILTKRANVMANHLALYADKIPQNVHFGITAENQNRLDERMEALADFKGRLFLSCEPMLGAINISEFAGKIDWVICGGEKAQHARDFRLNYAVSLYRQCQKLKIPFFFKSVGSTYVFVYDNARPTVRARQYPAWHNEKGGNE